MSQVLPKPINVPLMREATRLGKARNIENLSPAALESMSLFDLGGMEISYSITNHTGLDFADLSIIGASGKFRR